MKKISLIIIAMLSMNYWSTAQFPDDALRYSQVFYSGTARFNSMGGAFTALGGDVSTLSQNPAGIGVFRSSEVSVTPQLFHIKTIANFKTNSSVDYQYDFNLNQAGVVVNLINKNSESGLISLNVGYSFNKTNNFNQSIVVEGISDKSSLADYWTEYNDGYYKDEMSYDAFLGWKTYVIDSLAGSGTRWGTVYSGYGSEPSIYGQTIKRLISYDGFTGEHAFSVGGNWSNKLYFGATFGISSLSYQSHYEHIESTEEDLPSRYFDLADFTSFVYTSHYENSGTGYSFKLGTIYRPIETLRLGLAFHSPTLFRINEIAYDNITSHFDIGGTQDASNDPQRYNYALTTPFRVMAGAALQIKKLAIISTEYEFVDYRTARFSETGDDYDYSAKNQDIKNSLISANNIRLGAEVRLSKIYLRGGYSYYGRAWKSGDTNDYLDYNALSFGFGIREQNINVDFGFTSLTNPHNYILYDTSQETAMSDMSIHRNIFNVTFGYKFSY